jgi:hypothetical protein
VDAALACEAGCNRRLPHLEKGVRRLLQKAKMKGEIEHRGDPPKA